MRRLSVVLAVLLFAAVAASSASAQSSTGGAVAPPAVGNVNVYYGQLKGAGQFGGNVSAVSKTTGQWTSCGVRVCGGYKPIRKHGQKMLVLKVPHREVLVNGDFGYTDSNGLYFDYTDYSDSAHRFSLTRIPFTRRITIDGHTSTFHLAYAGVQLYDAHRPFPQGCDANGCTGSMK